MSIIKVQSERYTVEPLYQWDKNQVLEISGLSLPSVPEIHFTNEVMDKAIVRQAAMDGSGVITVDVPNSLLQKPYKIKVYVCTYEGDTFETLYTIEVPVKARKKPNDYTIEVDDNEVYSFNALENLVNNAVKNFETETANIVAECEDIKRQAVAECEDIKSEFADAIQNVSDLEQLTDRLADDTQEVKDRDYIVEQGTATVNSRSGHFSAITWIYRKWASGLVECWGVSDIFSVAGYVYDLIDFPISFTETPIVTHNVQATVSTSSMGENSLQIRNVAINVTKALVGIYIGNKSGVTSSETKLHIYAVGKWQ